MRFLWAFRYNPLRRAAGEFAECKFAGQPAPLRAHQRRGSEIATGNFAHTATQRDFACGKIAGVAVWFFLLPQKKPRISRHGVMRNLLGQIAHNLFPTRLPSGYTPARFQSRKRNGRLYAWWR
ncbi:MAG: hypothetical protein LBK13_12270 [Spirochaetales bacterium]|nr:hypothetical protein [Spirochaetales bacterium]